MVDCLPEFMRGSVDRYRLVVDYNRWFSLTFENVFGFVFGDDTISFYVYKSENKVLGPHYSKLPDNFDTKQYFNVYEVDIEVLRYVLRVSKTRVGTFHLWPLYHGR